MIFLLILYHYLDKWNIRKPKKIKLYKKLLKIIYFHDMTKLVEDQEIKPSILNKINYQNNL